MRKRVFALLFALLLSLGACAEADWPRVDYVIPDAPFVNSMLKISIHYADYEGKVISLVGYVDVPEAQGEPFFVGRDYRCCGADTTPYGFVCLYGGELPADDSWVEVAGTLTKYTDANGVSVLALDVLSIRPAEEGERVVTS